MITKLQNRKVLLEIITAVVLLLGLIFGSITIAGNNPGRRADKYLDLGGKYLSELDYEQALVAYRQVLEIEPKNLDAYKGGLAAYAGLGDREGMAEFYTDALGVIESLTKHELKTAYETAVEIYLYADVVYTENHEAAAQAQERGYNTLGRDERIIRALIREYGILAGIYIDAGDYKKEEVIYQKIVEKKLENADALSGWEQRVRDRFQEYLSRNGGSGNAPEAIAELTPELATEPTLRPAAESTAEPILEPTAEPTPEPTPEPIRVTVKETDIQADSVFDQEGYGCLTINGVERVEDWDNPENAIPRQTALIDAIGNFVFPYKSTSLTYYISDGVVSLTNSSPYKWSEYSSVYYNLDGTGVFVPEVTTDEYTTEDTHIRETILWHGSPMRDGYALVIKEVSTWNVSGIGGGNSLDFYSYIMDKSGTITCTLPEEFNKIVIMGDVGFGTKYSLGWCGEGLFAVFENEHYENGYWYPSEAKGYMDPAGNMVLDLSGRGFTDLRPFHEGLAAVQSERGMIGFIDKTGALVIPCIYDDTESNFSADGICAVKKDGKWGYIGRDGSVVIPFEYDNAYGAGDGLASVVKDGQCGLVDYSNRVIVPLEYDDISSCEGGTVYAIKEGVLYIIQRVTDF